LNNIATIYAGGPDLRSNYRQEYLNSVDRRNAERKQRAEKQGEKDAYYKGKKAEFLLGEDAEARRRLQAVKEKDLSKLEAAATLADTRAYAEKIAGKEQEVRVAEKAAEQAALNQRNREDNATRLQVERIQERGKAASEGDKGKQKILDEQHGLYLTGKQQIMGNKARWIQDLKNGRDPQDVRSEWADFLDAGDLLPEYMASVQAFFDAKIEPLLEEVERSKFAQQYQNQGPMKEQMVTPQDIQGARQSTRQGQRY
jgi:hypothetical protein